MPWPVPVQAELAQGGAGRSAIPESCTLHQEDSAAVHVRWPNVVLMSQVGGACIKPPFVERDVWDVCPWVAGVGIIRFSSLLGVQGRLFRRTMVNEEHDGPPSGFWH